MTLKWESPSSLVNSRDSCQRRNMSVLVVLKPHVVLSLCLSDCLSSLLTRLARQIPNACTTIGLPMDIFDFDISPSAEPKKLDLGDCAYASK